MERNKLNLNIKYDVYQNNLIKELFRVFNVTVFQKFKIDRIKQK